MEVKETAKHRRFLMLDKRNITHKKNALLSLGTVAKHAANPLFEEDKPWEKRIDNLYGNIAYDLEEDIYKCWYSPFTVAHATGDLSLDERLTKAYEGHPRQEMGVCYATSPDGIVWNKPNLGLINYEHNSTNNILSRGIHGSGIFKDDLESNPKRLYKSISQGMNSSFSADGLNWSVPTPISGVESAGDTHNNALWAPTLEKYVGFTRTWSKTNRQIVGPETKTNHAWGREIARIESPDFEDWSQAEVIIKCDSWEQQPYAMPVFFHAGIYIGLIAVHDQLSDRVWTELAVSEDTKTWERIEKGTPLIPCSEEPLDYDYGCVYACASPVFLKNEIRLYYGGSDWLHFSWRKGCLALATLRPDGFAGYVQERRNEPAKIGTKSFFAKKGIIKISVDIERDGLLNARLLSLGGDLVKEARVDRSCVDSDLFTSLPDHEAQYRIEFELHAAKLYSFTIDEQVQGEQKL